MQILIIGDGKVGYTLAEIFALDGHDITIIDSNAEALRKASEKLDVLCIQGSGSSISTLREAGIEKMDIVVAVTSSDELNMICSVMSHKLSKAKIFARIRNPEYAASELFIKEMFGIDLCVNPELLAANEISRLMRYSYALSIESFAKGKLEIFECQLSSNSVLIETPLSMLMQRLPHRVLICLVKRGTEVFIPNGDTVLLDGDHVYISGEPKQNLALAKYLQLPNNKLRNIMIVGGSRIAYYLAAQLEKLNMNVRIIEQSSEKCDKLHELLPQTMIINGDGTDHEILSQEFIDDMDAFVALTDRDEENIFACLHALDCNVPKVVAKIARSYYSRIAKDISTVNPKELAADRIARSVRGIINSHGSFVERLYRIVGGAAEILEFSAVASSKVVNTPLKDLKLKPDVLVAAIVHGNDIIIPRGDSMILPRDSVIIITTNKACFVDLNEIMVGV